jgi:predicted permease
MKGDSMTSKRKFLLSAVLGLFMAIGLHFVQTKVPDSPKMNTVREVASVLMMPATIFTSLTRQVHNKSVVLIIILDFLFYTLCFYGIITIISPRKRKS